MKQIISWLFNYLKQPDRVSISNTHEYIPTLWEDDHCMIELLPFENKDFVIKQAEQVKLFADQHRTEFGFTDAYRLKPSPFPTVSCEIRADYMHNTLISSQLPEFKKIQIQGTGLFETKNIRTKVFGFSDFIFCFEITDEFVKNIWLAARSINSASEYEIILNALYNLGEENEFILVDWNRDEVVDLKSRTEISRYLKGYKNT